MSDVDNSAALENTPAVVPGIVDPAAALPDPSAPAPLDPTGETPAEPSEEPDKGKTAAGLQKAINRLTRQRGDAERRAIKLEAELEAERKYRPQAVSQPTGGELKQSDFASYDDFIRAQAAKAARDAVKEELTASQRESAKQTAEQDADKRKADFVKEASKQAEAAGLDFEDDWEALTTAPKLSGPVALFLFEAEHKALVTNYLANNPDELARISDLPPVAAVRELTKVEARLGAKTPARRSTAPAPVPTVGATSAATSNVERMSHADLLKLTQKWSRN